MPTWPSTCGFGDDEMSVSRWVLRLQIFGQLARVGKTALNLGFWLSLRGLDLNQRPLGYESGGLVSSGPSGAVPCRPVRASCRPVSPRAAEVRVVRLQMVCTKASKRVALFYVRASDERQSRGPDRRRLPCDGSFT